jgi:acyl-CoA thioesterase I
MSSEPRQAPRRARHRNLYPWGPLSLLLVLGVTGCGGEEFGGGVSDTGAVGSAVEPQSLDEGSGNGTLGGGTGSDGLDDGGQRPLVFFLGTSLTEGLGLSDPASEAWPARVAVRAQESGRPIQIRNAGLAGETSAGARRRVTWLLGADGGPGRGTEAESALPDVFVLESGANDGLRGLGVEQLEENLDAILSHLRSVAPEATLVLVGMEAPPNLGSGYAEAFRAVFPRTAARWDARLVPFLLDGVAGVPELNQDDRIHPTAEGHDRMAEVAWPVLRSALEGIGRLGEGRR